MKCPADFYTASPRAYQGIPEPHYPFHDRTVLVTNCGRLCLYRKKINLSITLAGQAVGVKEVDNGIWLVSFMEYDLGYITTFAHASHRGITFAFLERLHEWSSAMQNRQLNRRLQSRLGSWMIPNLMYCRGESPAFSAGLALCLFYSQCGAAR